MQYIPTQTSKYHVGFHELPLLSSWLVLANLTIIVSAFKWHKYSYYIHTVIGLMIIGLTLSGTLHVLFEVGIGYNPTKRFQILHNTIGLIVVVWLSFQLITGVISRMLLYSRNVHPKFVVWSKRLHYISGFLIVILAKFDYLIISYRRKKYLDMFGYLLFDFICIVIYLWLKFKYPTLSQTIIQNQLKASKDEVQSQASNEGFYGYVEKQLSWIKNKISRQSLKLPQIKYLPVIYQSQREIPICNYFIFNDYVYDLDPIEQIHPGGQQVISLIQQREADRFFYGFYPIEISSGYLTHSHSEDSLKICGQPIARIERNSPMKRLADYTWVKMSQCKKIHSKSSLRLIYFEPALSESQNWIQFKYDGFTKLEQLGQYFSLSLSKQKNHRIARLYTTVWCLRPQNIEFMERQYPGSTTHSSYQSTNPQIEVDSLMKFQKQEVIPLMIKRYNDGQLTKILTDLNTEPKIILSKPLGAGLKYGSLSSEGKVIILAGGTGLLPFLDLIDLLYKRVRVLQKSNISGYLLKNDPILLDDIIQNRQFILYFACQQIQDVHPLSLYQINILSHSKLIKFKSFMRVKQKEGSSQIRNLYQNIIFQDKKFNQQIQQDLTKKYNICKIYVCGPCSMNADFSKIIKSHNLPADLYHFV